MNPHNLTGKGIWIWKAHQCEGGDLDAIAARALSSGFSHIILKINDGDDDYQIWNGRDYAAELIPKLRLAGITVWGWNYIYGDPPARDAGKTRYWELEAQRNIRRIQQLRPLGLQGYVIDAEREYEVIPDRHNKAAAYMRLLRGALPNFPLALASWKYPSQHRGFAWNAFRPGLDLDMPQVYWIKAHNAAQQLDRSFQEFAALQPRLPYLPVGPGFFEHDWRPTVQDLADFLNRCVALGLPAASIWAWDHLGLRGNESHNPRRLNFSAEWDAVARFQWPGAVPAPAPAPVPVVAPPPVPPSGDVVDQYLAALNSHDPDRVIALYSANAGHVTAQSSVIGLAAIRAFYAGLFARLPGAAFALKDAARQENLRSFRWTASAPGGAIQDGADMLGILRGRIQYHYTSFTITSRP